MNRTPSNVKPGLALRLRAWLAVALLSTLGLAGAQGDEFLRFRVAVLDFDVNDITGTLFEPGRLGRAMATEFETPLGQSRRFVVITRLDLEKVLEELALGPTGVLKPEQVQAFGEIAGVNIIITGNITVFSPTSYSISAKFIDVSTGELVDAETLRANSPEEFYLIARQFVDRALIRFPLRGSVFAIEEGAVYINVGIEHGLTTSDETGVIYRPREVEGRSIPLRIGTFRVKQVYENLALIEPVLEGGHTLMEGDLVTIQPVAAGAGPEAPQATETLPAAPEAPPATAEPPAEEPAAVQRAWVRFSVDPESAQVFVNDKPVESQFELEPGSYRVSISAEGYEAQSFDLQVAAGARIDRRIVLQLALNSVYFDVLPGGSSIWVDGQPVEGISALLPAGMHELRVEAEGYEPQVREFEVQAGKIELVEVRLVPTPIPTAQDPETPAAEEAPAAHADDAAGQPAPVTTTEPSGFLDVTAPIGTVVVAQRTDGWISALPASKTHSQRLELPPGEYKLTLLAPSDALAQPGLPTSQALSVVVREDEVTGVEPNGYLGVTDAPAGVIVKVAKGEDGVPARISSEISEWEPGDYTVSVKHEGEPASTFTVTVEPWRLTMVQMPAELVTTREMATQAPEEPATEGPDTTATQGPADAPPVVPLETADTGVLRLSANVSPVTYTIEGTESLTLEASEEEVEVVLAAGLYTVVASAPGHKDVEDVLFVDRGGEVDLAFMFEGQALRAVMGVMGTNQGDRLFLSVVASGRTPARTTAWIAGPPGWNGDAEYNLVFDAAEPFVVLEDVPAARGEYEVRLSGAGTTGGTSRLTISEASAPRPVSGTNAAATGRNQVNVWWSPVPWARRYEVRISGAGGVWNGSVFGSAGTTTVRVPGFRDGTYDICVSAHDWETATTAASQDGGTLLSSMNCWQARLVSEHSGVSDPSVRDPAPPRDPDPPDDDGPVIDLPPPVGPPP